MGDYFRSARVIARALDPGAAGRRARPSAQVASRRVGRQFEIAADGVRFVDLDARRVAAVAVARGVPDRASSAGLRRLGAGADLHRAERRPLLRRRLRRHGRRAPAAPAAARAAPGLYARLSEMHDCGLLTRIFPEFAKVHCRVVRDFYHKYTVDEHTLLAIRNVESLLDPQTAEPRSASARSCSELRAPELLTLALLFHDVGKWREADHAQESVRLAQSDARPARAADGSAAHGRVPDPPAPRRCRRSRSGATPKTRRSSRSSPSSSAPKSS